MSENKKPRLTKQRKEKKLTYIWTQSDNPNVYSWQLFNESDVVKKFIDEEKTADIPVADGYEDVVQMFSDEALENKKKQLLKRLKNDPTNEKLIVSLDKGDKYKITGEFIKKKGLKIYGGTAINSYLGLEDKFYSDDDNPDYDVFSPNPWQHAKELADLYYNKGYNFVEAKAGVHKGTYKVLVNLWPVADISYIPRTYFDKIKSYTVDGLQIVSPDKLYESIYKELSDPMGNPTRWSKIAIREKLLNRWVENTAKNCNIFEKKQISPLHFENLKVIYSYMINKNIIFKGDFAYNSYIEVGGSKNRLYIMYYEGIVENADFYVKQLLPQLKGELEVITSYNPVKELNDTEYVIYLKEDGSELKPILKLTNLTMCIPYQEYLNRYIVAIDYLKYELYLNAVFSDDIKSQKCKLRYLTKIQNNFYKKKKIYDSDKSIFQRFITNCVGPIQENLKVHVLERMKEREEIEKETIIKYVNDKMIKITPIRPIPKECLNKYENDCVYPCAWNDERKICDSVPHKPYYPKFEEIKKKNKKNDFNIKIE